MTSTKVRITIVACLVILCVGAIIMTRKKIAAYRTRTLENTLNLSLLDDIPPEVKIFSCPPNAPFRTYRHHGRGVAVGQNFKQLLEDAYSVWQSRIIVNVPIPDGKYGFIFNYSQMSENVEGLQAQIQKQFGLSVRREMIETNVLIMMLESPNAPGLKRAKDHFLYREETNSYMIRGAPIFTLVSCLEDSFGTVVLDETGMRGKFDIDMKWNSGTNGLEQALEEQCGFKLTAAQKPVQFVVVDKPR